MSDEIKSTMEKVMERLAAMDSAGGASPNEHQEEEHTGMRLAAAYLRGEEVKLGAELAAVGAREQAARRRGMARTLLRNIFLPREEEQLAPAEKAMTALVDLAQVAGAADRGEMLRFLGDLKKILEQYLSHRRQLQEQLRERFAQQMPQLEEEMARQTGVATKLTPEQHPKFQEEWQRLQDELNSQYGRALEQYKEQLSNLLAAA